MHLLTGLLISFVLNLFKVAISITPKVVPFKVYVQLYVYIIKRARGGYRGEISGFRFAIRNEINTIKEK